VALSISPNSKLIASGSKDEFQLWDAESGKLLKTLKRHKHYVNALNFSPDSNLIVSGGWDEKVRVWDVSSGKLRKTLKYNDFFIATLGISPDGKLIACGGGNIIKLWDAELYH
jgi:WD40 repeat protein